MTPRCPWPSSKPWNPATTAFWLPLLEIIWIDILLSGDNAVPGQQINEQKHSLEINGRRRQAHRDYEFIGQLLTSPVPLFVEVREIYHSMTGITLARDMVRCATAIVAPDFAVSASCPLP
ncbi:MAG: hypothetical protein CR217_03260 [Beijerinckiaceae bacterium]|nr:MAG: hypothetical protein CR217_03260 [Beijerinckiaceae bacterium]